MRRGRIYIAPFSLFSGAVYVSVALQLSSHTIFHVSDRKWVHMALVHASCLCCRAPSPLSLMGVCRARSYLINPYLTRQVNQEQIHIYSGSLARQLEGRHTLWRGWMRGVWAFFLIWLHLPLCHFLTLTLTVSELSLCFCQCFPKTARERNNNDKLLLHLAQADVKNSKRE